MKNKKKYIDESINYQEEIDTIIKIIEFILSKKSYQNIRKFGVDFNVDLDGGYLNICKDSFEIYINGMITNINLDTNVIYDKFSSVLEHEMIEFNKTQLNDFITKFLNNNKGIKRNILLTDIMK